MVNEELGGNLAASHLLDQGARRLIYLAGYLELHAISRRLSGVRKAVYRRRGQLESSRSARPQDRLGPCVGTSGAAVRCRRRGVLSVGSAGDRQSSSSHRSWDRRTRRPDSSRLRRQPLRIRKQYPSLHRESAGRRMGSWPSNCSSTKSASRPPTPTKRKCWIPHLIPDAARDSRSEPKGTMSLTWSALPIAPDEDFDGAPLLRNEFGLEEGHGSVVRATLHATAHGIFEAYSTASPCPTMYSAQGGAAMSGGCATAATT